MRKLVFLGVVASLVGCAQEPESELPADLLAGDEAFVAVRKPVSEEMIGQAKQDWPNGIFGAAAFTLGTRVVSFKLQNGKLFIFDVSDGHNLSAAFSPEVVVEAYPVLSWHKFESLAHSDRYVLVDASRGLNKFGVTGEVYTDPFLSQFGSLPLNVGLSYLQKFRSLPDGATYEQVYAGQIDFGGGPQSGWGTLGISLRRYQVGDGYTITPDPFIPFYFLSDFRSIPDSGGFFEANPVKWNLHPGMRPIPFVITVGAQRAQADFPDVDLLGAFKRGIESWNDVLGFKAFEAKFVDSEDTFARDDVNALIVDYPGQGAGFAFADWRSNPNNGETRGGSIYFDAGAFLAVFDFIEDDPPAAALAPKAKPSIRGMEWSGMHQGPGCMLWAPQYEEKVLARLRADRSLTAKEKGARYIQHVIAHEMGHVLGLRHNFMGSLIPPTSSVMDYNNIDESVASPIPQAHDIQAIHYLYGLSPDLPSLPFCTDGDTRFVADCQRFDSGADPLEDFLAPNHSFIVEFILTGDFPLFFLDFYLNETLGYARADFGARAARGLQVALDRSAVPVDATTAGNPFQAAMADAVSQFVLNRLVFEPVGPIVLPPTDPDVISAINDQAGGVIQNADGIRSFPARRQGVDVLKQLQDVSSYVALRTARDAVAAQLAAGGVDVPLTEDLLARIDRALTPYFN